MNVTKGKYGYVLASVAGNTVNFALSLNTTGSHTMATFFYLRNEVCGRLQSNHSYVDYIYINYMTMAVNLSKTF